jgi:multidrug efflux pump subunit AcrA (membrane-fusion protein)
MKLAMRLGLGAVVVAAVALLVVVFGWGRTTSAAPSAGAGGAHALPAVTTVYPERQVIRQTVEQPGQIEGFEQTPLYAKISGYVRKWNVDMGDRVKAGQVLAELAVPEMEEELRQKEAAVTLAQAEVTQAQRALKAAEADLHKSDAAVEHAEAGRVRADASLVRWRSEYQRVHRLVSNQSLDQQTYDSTVDQLKSAQAARDESKANVDLAQAAREQSRAQRDQAESMVQVAEAKTRVAEAERKRTATLLEYAQIRAPFAGVVTRRNVDTGHLVQASTNGGSSGTPLFIVVRTDPLRIFVDVPESAAGLVHDGMPAHVRVETLQEQEFEGRVTRTGWVLDNRTRTLRTQIDLPNKDGQLRPGMYASGILTVERPATLTVPASAILSQDEQPAFLRVADGKAVRTPVKLGVRQGTRVEVLKLQTRPPRPGEPAVWESPTGKEEVVVNAPASLADGMAVRTQPAGNGDRMALTGQPRAQ